MFKQGLFFSFFIVLITLSCETKTTEKAEKIVVKPTLIHPLYFQEDIGQNLNFPFWFNDSIIVANKIKTITHTIFGSALDEDEENDRVEQLPRKNIVYTFNENGKLIQVAQTTFSEGIIIAYHNYFIKKSKIPGYYFVLADDEHLGLESVNKIYSPFAFRKNVLQFDEEFYDERLSFIANKDYFGALSVDSIAKPSPKDWVILGTPERPVKRYKVLNKVKEQQVTTYEYWNKNYPKVVINPEFPFTNKRYFNYEHSIFVGYTDSVFIDKEFVTTVRTELRFRKNLLPIEISHIKSHKDSQLPFKKIEQFSYTYY